MVELERGPYAIRVSSGKIVGEVTDPEVRIEGPPGRATSIAAYISLAMDQLDIDGNVWVEDRFGQIIWRISTGAGRQSLPPRRRPGLTPAGGDVRVVGHVRRK